MVGVMVAVCCMDVVENTFYYPLLQSNPILNLFEAFRNPRENDVYAKFRGHTTKTKPKFKKMARQILDIRP